VNKKGSFSEEREERISYRPMHFSFLGVFVMQEETDHVVHG
jgi:hypothetical protein